MRQTIKNYLIMTKTILTRYFVTLTSTNLVSDLAKEFLPRLFSSQAVFPPPYPLFLVLQPWNQKGGEALKELG